MKKYASLLILTVLLLTGCGSTAGTAESASSPKDSVAVEESNSETEKEESSSDQTYYYYMYADFFEEGSKQVPSFCLYAFR